MVGTRNTRFLNTTYQIHYTDNHDCKQIAYIKYVHELQHLLFGLGINHEMEV